MNIAASTSRRQLPDNTTLLMYVSPGTPFGNISIITTGDRVSVLLCSNATVFMGGAGFWVLAQQNVEEQVVASTGAVVSTRKLFAGPQTGEVRHVLSGVAGQTVIYTKVSSLPISAESSLPSESRSARDANLKASPSS